jgi:hypothetical protein
MKVFFPLILVSLLIFSCTKYQYATLDTDLTKNQKGEVFFENDTVLLRYKFTGADCPAQFQIYNKLDRPLYINWQKSSITLINKGQKADSIVSRKTWLEDTYILNPPAKEIPVTTLIPPGSFAAALPVNLRKRFFHLSYGKFETQNIGENKVRSQKYPKQDSPLKFRSRITLSLTDTFDEKISFSNEFWVAEVTETVLEPETLDLYKDRKDRFYVSKSSGLGAFSGSMGVLGYLMFMALTR